jgi:hypothetical protein
MTHTGRLSLVDHPKRLHKAEMAAMGVGGEKKECLLVLAAWQQELERARRANGDARRLPSELTEKFRQAVSKWKWRDQHNKGDSNIVDVVDFTDGPAASATVGHLWLRGMPESKFNRDMHVFEMEGRLFARLFSKCHPGMYCITNHGFDAKVGKDAEVYWVLDHPRLAVRTKLAPKYDSFYERGCTPRERVVRVGLPLHWYDKVYRRGLGVVDGVLVLDVEYGSDEGFSVVALRYNDSSKFTADRAWVVGGTLTWLTPEVPQDDPPVGHNLRRQRAAKCSRADSSLKGAK